MKLYATSSEDPDMAPGSTKLWSYTCEVLATGQECDGFETASSSDGVASVPASLLLVAGNQLKFTVNFTVISNGGSLVRSAVASTIVTPTSPDVPVVRVRAHPSVVSRSDSISLIADVRTQESKTLEAIEYTWQVSSERQNNAYISSSEKVLNILSNGLSQGNYVISVSARDPATGLSSSASSLIPLRSSSS